MRPAKRVAWIDAAKGIGIWLVAAGHLLPGGPVAATAANLIWAFHMLMFFFVSGLTARRAEQSAYVPALLKCARSIVVPYAFFSLLSIALWAAHPVPAERPGNVAEALAAMLRGVGGEALAYNTPLWFFTCLFCVRALFLTLSLALPTPGRLLAASLALALAAHLAFAAGLPRLPWNLDVAAVALVFFATGHCFARWGRPPDKLPPAVRPLLFIACLAALWLIAGANGRVDMNYRIFNTPLLFYAGAHAGIGATLLLAGALGTSPWLAAVGRAAIVIFPMHALLWHFLPERTLPILGWYVLRLSGSPIVSAFTVGAVEIALCMPFYWLLRRYAPVLIGGGAPTAPAPAR